MVTSLQVRWRDGGAGGERGGGRDRQRSTAPPARSVGRVRYEIWAAEACWCG